LKIGSLITYKDFPEGENTITLTLLDSTGQAAKVPLNPVTRKFQLEKTPAAK
jgi:hypothetical protein